MHKYNVKYWTTNEKGFREQQLFVFIGKSKNDHKKAEKAALKKYGSSIEIISVTYQ